VAKNVEVMALRHAHEGDWAAAIAAFDNDRQVNGLGIDTRGDRINDLSELIAERGVEPTVWYGVRLFTDGWTTDRSVTDPEVLSSKPSSSRANATHIVDSAACSTSSAADRSSSRPSPTPGHQRGQPSTHPCRHPRVQRGPMAGAGGMRGAMQRRLRHVSAGQVIDDDVKLVPRVHPFRWVLQGARMAPEHRPGMSTGDESVVVMGPVIQEDVGGPARLVLGHRQ
jgi:hypothetical protein